MPPLPLEGWDHITWPVPDIGAAEAWYCRVLGGKTVMRHGYAPQDVAGGRTKQIWIQVGDAIVNLAEGPSMNRPDEAHFYHYAFKGGSLEHLDGWLDHLAQEGVDVLGPFGHGNSNVVSIYFDDPDNYRLEISFEAPDFETVCRLAPERGWKLGNPVASYDWK